MKKKHGSYKLTYTVMPKSVLIFYLRLAGVELEGLSWMTTNLLTLTMMQYRRKQEASADVAQLCVPSLGQEALQVTLAALLHLPKDQRQWIKHTHTLARSLMEH